MCIIAGNKPSTIDIGSPGNLPLLSVIFRDKKEPTKSNKNEIVPDKKPKFAAVLATTIE